MINIEIFDKVVSIDPLPDKGKTINEVRHFIEGSLYLTYYIVNKRTRKGDTTLTIRFLTHRWEPKYPLDNTTIKTIDIRKQKNLLRKRLDPLGKNYVGHNIARELGVKCCCDRNKIMCPYHGR